MVNDYKTINECVVMCVSEMKGIYTDKINKYIAYVK